MKRPLRNIVSFTIGDAGSRVIGFLISVYLARVLAPPAFGVINIGLAVLGYLLLIQSPGIQVLEARNAAAARGHMPERAGAVLSARLLMALLLCLLTWLLTTLLITSTSTGEVIGLYTLSLIPLALLLDWFFQGKEEFFPVSVSRLINYGVFGLVALTLVRSERDVPLTPLAFLAGNVAGTAVLFFRYRQAYGKISLAWNPPLWRVILKENLPVGGAMFLAQSVVNLPPLIIGLLLSTTAVGMYSAAMKLTFLLLILDRMFNAIFLPAVTRYFSGKADEVSFLVNVTLKLILIVLLPLTICGVIAAQEAIRLVFGAGYEEAAPLLRILMGFVLLTMVNSLFTCTLIGAGSERVYSRVMVLGTSVLAVAVVVLTILFGPQGAAWGVIAGEGVTALMMMLQAARRVRLPSANILLRPMLASVLMLVAAYLLRDWNIIVVLVLPLLVYAAVVLLTGSLERNEIRFVRERFV